MNKQVAEIRKSGVVGAGEVGVGLAQKIAGEGFEVSLV
jgi:3-hydroxyacyl-CoA dehydrogenase